MVQDDGEFWVLQVCGLSHGRDEKIYSQRGKIRWSEISLTIILFRVLLHLSHMSCTSFFSLANCSKHNYWELINFQEIPYMERLRSMNSVTDKNANDKVQKTLRNVRNFYFEAIH